MNILDVQQYLADTFLPGIAITDPVAATIVRAYKTLPDAGRALTDLPCAMMPGHELQETNFKPAWIEQKFASHLQVFVKQSEVEQGLAAQMAAAFQNAIALKLSDTQRLGATASLVRGFRGGPETLARLEWAGDSFTGLDLFIDITLITSKEHSA